MTLNGAPLAGVQVTFAADGNEIDLRAVGYTDATGRYRLRADSGEDGAAVGRYAVVVTDPPSSPVPGGSRKGPPPASRVPGRYMTVDQTPLKAEVKAGSQTVDLPLTTGPAGRGRSAP